MFIYEVECQYYIDDEHLNTKSEILRRFSQEDDAKKFKRDFEDLWQVHSDDMQPIYPSRFDCEKELKINKVKVDESYR